MDTSGTEENANNAIASNAGALIRKTKKPRVELKTSQSTIFVHPSNGSGYFKWDDCENVLDHML